MLPRPVLWQLHSQAAADALPPWLLAKIDAFLFDPLQWANLSPEAPREQVGFEPGGIRGAKPEALHVAMICHGENLDLPVFQHADGYYIPGPVCRQGDLLAAVGQTQKPIWIERGAFLSPTDFRHVLTRVGTPSRIHLVEAGSHFGYGDRVLDPRSLMLYEAWRENTGCTVSLSFTDLVAGEASASPYRPAWTNRADLMNFVFRMATAWQTGMVFKVHPQASVRHQEMPDLASGLESLAQRSDWLQSLFAEGNHKLK